MSEDLKPCPFCGELPNREEVGPYKVVECINEKCPCQVNAFNSDASKTAEIWNTRPIEDDLRARLEAAEAANLSKGRTVIVIDILGETPDNGELRRLAENWISIGMPRGKYELHPAEIEQLTQDIKKLCASYNKR